MEAFVNFGGGKPFGKIGNTVSGLSDIEITDSMV